MSTAAAAVPSAATRFWQVGLVVEDIGECMAELSRALGLTWGEVLRNNNFGEDMDVVFSREGPPYFELIQGAPGTEWDSTQGSRLHHLGYWVPDLTQTRQELEDRGAPVVVDGQARGFPLNYHALPAAGFRIEMFDASFKDAFRASRGFDDVG